MLWRQAAAWGVELNDARRGVLARYAHLLSSYREANVVGERDERVLLRDHVLDSLSCALVPEVGRSGRLVDVGSGGGLPGIPLAVAFPGTEVMLLEATGKKVRFLEGTVERLALANVRTLNARAEDVGRGEGRGSYAVATSRALASLAVVAEYCLPLLRPGGVAVAMKGIQSAEEMESGEAAAVELGGRVREVIQVPVAPGMPERNRRIVVLEKVGETPRRYPRRPGLARKHPLGGGGR